MLKIPWKEPGTRGRGIIITFFGTFAYLPLSYVDGCRGSYGRSKGGCYQIPEQRKGPWRVSHR